MGISFDEIAMKIVEKEDNLIAKAFTMQIATLLRQNGIIPIVTRAEETPEIVSGKNNYIITKKFGVSFHELDCTEHDKEIYDNAIDDFVNACKEDIMCQTFGLHQNGIEKIAEQLKAGGENE